MNTKWMVLKFGGTSVSGLPQWTAIAALMLQRLSAGYRVLLVCSAVSGVTNALSALAEDPGCEEKLVAILERHRRLAAELGVSATRWLEQAESMLHRCARSLAAEDNYPAQAELLAIGEWLSTRIGAAFLQQFAAVSWVDVREALQVLDEPELSPARQWLSACCAPGVDADLQRRWEQLAPVVITQGFVASTSKGQTALLGRGGSDASAALLAGRLRAFELEIWTDVPGLFSADPRLLPEARLLNELDYAEALEMAASGAKVVHPRCIRTAAATTTPVVIRDTARPQLAGTRIIDTAASVHGVKAITCQKGMVVLLLQNIDSRREVGFLARVFDIFRRHGLSIDLVATSETTTTVAINGPANHLDERALAAVVVELQTQCTVNVYSDCVCINLVGSAVRTALARVQSTMRFFDDHPLLMLSQSANDLCLSLLIKAQDHEILLQRAHAMLIPAGPEVPAGVFGARWLEIQA
jgi:diaminopimelate decarboxylase/aspartate kinase